MPTGTKQPTGINRASWLVRDLFATTIERKATRDGFGTGLVEAGKLDRTVMALCADLTESTRVQGFKDAYPDRFVQLGVSEQSMAAIAAGLALAGKVPFVASYAGFSPGRNWEQIRTTIALSDTNVKIVGAHAGITVGPDGATHQMTEDIALMRVMPNMAVVIPCDAREAHKATLAIAKLKGPAYIRLAREGSPAFTTAKTPFTLGRAETFRHGTDATVIAAGPLVYEALLAAEALSKRGIETRVINLHTLKPLDAKAIVMAAKETGAIVTLEEAQVAGGLGGAVCETLAAFAPVPVERMGLHDRFGESGEPGELLEAFGLTSPFVQMAVERALARKRGEKVPAVPEYVSAATERLTKLRTDVMERAVRRAPRKWGGTKPDHSLKSRTKKPA